ncbi:MAG: CrcB family protein [Alphaproteobacteria bacterium]
MTLSPITLALVASGGAIGSLLRFMLISYLSHHGLLIGSRFPFGTFAVNLIGSLMMGLVVGLLLKHQALLQGWHHLLFAFLAIGVLGGLTTFSSFAFDLVNLLQKGDHWLGVLYMLFSVIFSVFGLAAGLSLTKLY